MLEDYLYFCDEYGRTTEYYHFRTADGKASVALYAKDGKIWLNQQQMAELFATSKQTINYHIINILKENELSKISVVKEYLTTAADERHRLFILL